MINNKCYENVMAGFKA